MELPPPFVSRIRSQLALESDPFLRSLDSDPPVSLRINPAKEIQTGGSAVPWCSTGFYLEKRPVFTLDPLLHAGCYYVQDASSMVLEQVFSQLKISEKKTFDSRRMRSAGWKINAPGVPDGKRQPSRFE